MTAIVDNRESEIEVENDAVERDADTGPVEGFVVGNDNIHNEHSYGSLPWIGALRNPRVGPMVVLSDSGYLIPLCTAGDLLRGCKYFWQAL
jgi:hypothetical protein